jgi:hypothetical protein
MGEEYHAVFSSALDRSSTELYTCTALVLSIKNALPRYPIGRRLYGVRAP